MFNFSTLLTHPQLFIVGFIALAVSISLHEFSHVLVAYLQGDQTGKALGRLTLNPLRHLDPFGTVAILIAGIGWGRPAPFNPYNLRFRRWGSALVALGGPVMNILVVILAGYAYLLIWPHLGPNNLLGIFLRVLVELNAALAVFNLLPIAPLDGSHLLSAALTPANPFVAVMERYGTFILLALLFLGGGLLTAYLSFGIRVILTGVGLGSLI